MKKNTENYEELKKYYVSACDLARESFKDKTDLSGAPYFNHLYRVSSGCYKYEKSSPRNECVIVETAAMLHDLLEDCPEWNEKSLRFLFPDEIVDLVVILTKIKGENYLDSYIKRICENEFAIRIKLSDLRDNMDITRLPTFEQKEIDRLCKYHKAYKILEPLL